MFYINFTVFSLSLTQSLVTRAWLILHFDSKLKNITFYILHYNLCLVRILFMIKIFTYKFKFVLIDTKNFFCHTADFISFPVCPLFCLYTFCLNVNILFLFAFLSVRSFYLSNACSCREFVHKHFSLSLICATCF